MSSPKKPQDPKIGGKTVNDKGDTKANLDRNNPVSETQPKPILNMSRPTAPKFLPEVSESKKNILPELDNIISRFEFVDEDEDELKKDVENIKAIMQELENLKPNMKEGEQTYVKNIIYEMNTVINSKSPQKINDKVAHIMVHLSQLRDDVSNSSQIRPS